MNDYLGQQLGNYRLIRLLGQGGFADVYLGEHVYLKTQAALKVLQMRVVGKDIEEFLKEAQTIANLKHPHIVRVLDFGVEMDIPFLVMEFATLGTLRQRYPKGTRLPMSTIIAYIKQVGSALHYAHEHKIVHRDVKPENILLESNDDILLSDFGLALVAQSSRDQETLEMAGTISYMAPEQLLGKPRPASDQYSLGIVVYEWICGDRPFHGSFTEMYSQHLFVAPPPLYQRVPTLLREVDTVVQRALAKDPRQRFPTVMAFAEALEHAIQEAEPTLIVAPRGLLQPEHPAGESQIRQDPPDLMVEAKPDEQIVATTQSTFSRRNILLGALGLVVAGSAVTWLALSRKSSTGVVSNNLSPSSPSPSHSPSPENSTVASHPVGYLFFTYQGHSASVGTVSWAPNGQRIASGSSDRTAKIWTANSGTTLVTYSRHGGAVQSVGWSPDGTHIVSGGDDHTVQIWEAVSGSQISNLNGHTDTVWEVAWSPDGNFIASASNDKTVTCLGCPYL